MPTQPQAYEDAIWSAKQLHGVWPTTNDFQLGKVIVFNDGVPTHHTTLQNLGVQVTDTPDGGAAYWICAANGTFSVGAQASAIAHSGGVARVRGVARFNRESALILHAEGVEYKRIDDIPALQTQIRNFRKAGKWEYDWRVVTWVAVANGPVRMALSKNAQSSIGFEAEAAVLPSANEITDGRARIKLDLSTGSGLEMADESDGGTVVFRAMKLRRFRKKLDQAAEGGGLTPEDGNDELELCGPDDDDDDDFEPEQ